MSSPLSPSPRSTPRRHPERAVHDRAALYDLLGECLVVHVGTPAPLVLPMAFGRVGDRLYLHGARGNGLLRRAIEAGHEVCVEATRVDGLVVARAASKCSMNYRSAVIFGRLRHVEGDEVGVALGAILEHTLPGRAAECRAITDAERAATCVVALELAEASVKVREGAPNDGEADRAGGAWAGVLPLSERSGFAEPDVGVPGGELPPSVVRALLERAPRLAGEVEHDGVTISFDPRRLDVARVLTWLRDDSYWATDLELARFVRSVQGSFVAGAWDAEGAQVAFARVVTDGETFAWLADVFVARDARGRGLGRAVARALVEHPALSRVRKVLLGTRDAHGLYEQLGFEPVPDGRYMVRAAAGQALRS